MAPEWFSWLRSYEPKIYPNLTLVIVRDHRIVWPMQWLKPLKTIAIPSSPMHVALGDTAIFKRMNIYFERILVGPISVHLRVSITYTGVSGGLRSHIWPYFGILNNFPHFFWMNNSIEYSGLYWMNIFLNEYFGFCFELNFELNHF